jgi:hypothetical protein
MRHIFSLYLVSQKMVSRLTSLRILDWVKYRLTFLLALPAALFSATPPHVLMQCEESLHMKNDNTISILLSMN